MNALDKTIAELVPDWPALDGRQRAEIARRCARLVREQITCAPFHVRTGLHILFVLYRCFVLLRVGYTASGEVRAKLLAEFSALPWPMVFALERVLRAMTLLAYVDQPEVLAALGEQTIAERQEVFRAKRREIHRATSTQRENVMCP